jgi:hypothetical protein
MSSPEDPSRLAKRTALYAILIVDHGRSEHVIRIPQVFTTKKTRRFEQKSAFTCAEHASIQELVLYSFVAWAV